MTDQDYPHPSLITAPSEKVRLNEGIATRAGSYRIGVLQQNELSIRKESQTWRLPNGVFWNLIERIPSKSSSFDFPIENGVLSQLGYHVGEVGPPRTNRRAALYHGLVAPVARIQALIPLQHVSEWEQPGTVLRLFKMARCLDAFATNASYRASNMAQAIADWREDLSWLRDSLYPIAVANSTGSGGIVLSWAW
jgi:hypothetical protein